MNPLVASHERMALSPVWAQIQRLPSRPAEQRLPQLWRHVNGLAVRRAARIEVQVRMLGAMPGRIRRGLGARSVEAQTDEQVVEGGLGRGVLGEL
jgi:hypothetical protein